MCLGIHGSMHEYGYMNKHINSNVYPCIPENYDVVKMEACRMMSEKIIIR